MAAGSEREADQRVLLGTKASDSLLETLFLDNVKYSRCHGCNGHSCANVPSLVLLAQIYLLSLSLTYPKIYWSSPLSVGQGCLRLRFIV